jgi:4-amino-4-deoxy-L-arabinose transferase-like glycosyltransferase
VRQGLSRPFWLALVIAAFCLPLFLGLGRTDVENDEGIYSFAVDGILANGDWLNPRTSPHDDAVFLEKPPLKFWIVALPIRLGLLPHDEFGLRFWDALFGAIAFLYVFAIGRRLAGAVCGVVAVMVLFVYEPLLFDHGIRGNNMEAPLFLCYCGGIYHYLRWATLAEGRARRRHVAAVALFFYLGFMTKFVAALFLPVTLLVPTLILPQPRRQLFADFGTWVAAAAAVVALVVPWFVYQHFVSHGAVWSIMFSTHVLTRFTSSLDVSHVHPWNYYWITIWNELFHMGTAWLGLAGLALLGAVAIRERRVDAVTVIAWLVVPLTLMSAGTSKLHHYAYPFLPPAALMVGYGPGWLATNGSGYLERVLVAVQARLTTGTWSRGLRQVMLVLAVAAATLALATLIMGNVVWRVGGVTLLRNAHVARPLILAVLLATLAGRGEIAARVIFPAALLMLVLPMNSYEDVLRRARVDAHPLRSARDCLVDIRSGLQAEGGHPPGVYAIGEQRWFLHSYFYYLHHAGGWERSEQLDSHAVDDALFTPGLQRPVLIDDPDYRTFKADHEAALRDVPALPLREVLLLMPGPYAACGPSVTTRAPRTG